MPEAVAGREGDGTSDTATPSGGDAATDLKPDDVVRCPLCNTHGVRERIYGLACPHDTEVADLHELRRQFEQLAEEVALLEEQIEATGAVAGGAA
jgi:hypothetical protein